MAFFTHLLSSRGHWQLGAKQIQEMGKRSHRYQEEKRSHHHELGRGAIFFSLVYDELLLEKSTKRRKITANAKTSDTRSSASVGSSTPHPVLRKRVDVLKTYTEVKYFWIRY